MEVVVLVGVEFFVLSCSDFILCGYYFVEVDVLIEGVEQVYDVVVMVFYFEVGGWYIFNDIYYVQ